VIILLLAISEGNSHMYVEREIHRLEAENLATQFVVTQLLVRLRRAHPVFDKAIRDTLDDTANLAERVAIQLGKSASPEHTVKALSIIEKIRTMVFGDHDKPKHVVYRRRR
jgi:hypothetical protein